MDDDPQNLGALEVGIGRVLRIGVAASSIALTTGLILTLLDVGGSVTQLVLSAGLMILIATPAARVVISMVEYVRTRDWVFVGFTLSVLLALVGSVFAAFWLPGR